MQLYFYNYVYNRITELHRQQVEGIKELRKCRFRHLGQRKARQKMQGRKVRRGVVARPFK